MAYDGITVSAVIWELSGLIEGSRITKIYQAEKDEILLVCNKNGENYRLLISCNPSNPRIHLTRTAKENPLVAPQFCMVLRKHVQGGKIKQIRQYGFDRVVFFDIDTYNELGDPVIKTLIVEIMGRHSNIILIGESGIIYDAVKHVDEKTSSVREILPARHYLLPPAQDKISPDDTENISNILMQPLPEEKTSLSVSKFILNSVSGTSPLLCNGLCIAAGIDPDRKVQTLYEEEKISLCGQLKELSRRITERKYEPFIITEEDGSSATEKYRDFYCIDIGQNGRQLSFSSVNLTLDEFYTKRDTADRLRQKKASLVKCVSNAIARTERKISIYEGDIKSAEDFDTFRIKGELITANVYRIKQGQKSAEVENYYEENCPPITILLDENLTPAANAQQYFKKYRKKKSTCENAERNIGDALSEHEYLKSVETLLDNCIDNQDIAQIKEELISAGYLSATQKGSRKVQKKRSDRPEGKHLVLTVSDGYEVWIGKNNVQNDLITGKLSASNDVWLHVKNAPGSHVILRTSLKGGEFTKASIEDAAKLAALHSSLKGASKTEVDFTRVKYVKKPVGSRPGKVIYTNQKTIVTE